MHLVLAGLTITTLISAFALPAIASYLAVYVTIAGLLIFSGSLLLRDASSAWTPATKALLAAVLLLTVSVLMTGPATAENWLAPMILLLPLLAIGFVRMSNVIPRLARIEVFAAFALIGVALGAAAGIYEIWQGVDRRAGAGNNPIHYGGIMLLLGFFTLAGFESTKSKWRYIFLLGPVLGLSGVFLSGSRGPFLAAAALMLVLAPLIIAWNWRDRFFIVALALSSCVGVFVFGFSPLGSRAIAGVYELFVGVRAGELAVIDVPRSEMLHGTLAAFVQSPIWGHGWANMMTAAEAHFPADSRYRGFDNLHADLSNFAVLGGMLGLAGYVILIVAPFLVLAGMPAQHRRQGLLLGLTISVGYFILGLTNAMFGVLPQTVLYAVLMGCLMHLAIRAPVKALGE